MHIRTDLALESSEAFSDNLPKGITSKERVTGSVKVTEIEVTDDSGAKSLGKPIGKYITLEIKKPEGHCLEATEEAEAIARELSALLPQSGTVLIAGLGNRDITPDALGILTAEGCLATRQLDKSGETQSLGLRSVAKIVPGVLGSTGIESTEAVLSIAKAVNPSCIIVIDALAAKSTHRLMNTIQICNSGIAPGSGVKNARKELSEKTAGVPVIAVGVPTVVDGLTLAEGVLGHEIEDTENNEASEMIVTTKDIDSEITLLCKLLSLSINKALHSNYSVEDLYFLAQ